MQKKAPGQIPILGKEGLKQRILASEGIVELRSRFVNLFEIKSILHFLREYPRVI